MQNLSNPPSQANVPKRPRRVFSRSLPLDSRQPSAGRIEAAYDSRFDVQVTSPLQFIGFQLRPVGNACAVRNTFHEATIDSSVYDEMLVSVRPSVSSAV